MSDYLGFAITVFLLISSPGPIVALVVADGRRAFPWWTILGGLLSAQVLLVLALGLIHLAIGISPTLLLAGQILGGSICSGWVYGCSGPQSTTWQAIGAAAFCAPCWWDSPTPRTSSSWWPSYPHSFPYRCPSGNRPRRYWRSGPSSTCWCCSPMATWPVRCTAWPASAGLPNACPALPSA